MQRSRYRKRGPTVGGMLVAILYICAAIILLLIGPIGWIILVLAFLINGQTNKNPTVIVHNHPRPRRRIREPEEVV